MNAQRMLRWDNLLEFISFGMDRDLPDWVPVRTELPLLDFGPGEKIIPGARPFDYPEYDLDGEYGAIEALHEYADNSVGGAYAVHFLEHLADPRPLIREVSRVLAPGCPFNICVPHAQALIYLHDLDHKTPFVLDTWKNLLDQPYYRKGREGYRLRQGFSAVVGLAERNLMIFTQLIKKGEEES